MGYIENLDKKTMTREDQMRVLRGVMRAWGEFDDNGHFVIDAHAILGFIEAAQEALEIAQEAIDKATQYVLKGVEEMGTVAIRWRTSRLEALEEAFTGEKDHA